LEPDGPLSNSEPLNAGLEGFDELGKHLVHVADNAEIGDTEDGGLLCPLYAYTGSVADHMFANYAGVLKIDGEVGNKKVYDPRSWGKTAEAAMAARVTQACADLRATGTTLGK
jgi:hypothetical protein